MMETIDSDDDFADWEDDDEIVEVKSFFSDILLSSIQLLLKHDREHFDFDLQNIISISKYDDIGVIMLVNMIRRRVEEQGFDKVESLFISELKTEISSGDFINDETNMRPVLNDDQVLFLLRDHLVSTGLLADDDDDDEMENLVEAKQDITHSADEAGMKETLIRYQSLITALTTTSDTVIADDSYYFDGYSNISIHETMLRDEPRTSAYADALVANSDFIKGKVILDVGCGTGILCMLAVRAGARKVIGVDCSSIIERTQKVIDRNGMSDKITLVRGRLEEVELPLKNEEVDVIISEWMGYGLYYENMLSSVIYARDTYLSDQGVLMPSTALVYLEAMTATGAVDRVAWWGNVYGFDMTDMADLLSNEAQVQLLDQDDIISNRSLVHNLDIKLASDSDLDFIAPFTMVSLWFNYFTLKDKIENLINLPSSRI
jgi:2-polyprenyl-3-methyl-5-hydroxy-6-metoxy-1,4-benzoquinol methylase